MSLVDVELLEKMESCLEIHPAVNKKNRTATAGKCK